MFDRCLRFSVVDTVDDASLSTAILAFAFAWMGLFDFNAVEQYGQTSVLPPLSH